MRDRRVAWALALLATACGGHPEQKIIDQYFNAVRARDNQTLSSFSTAKFDEPVQSWATKGTLEETKEPVPLADLARKLKESEAALNQNKTDYSAYRQAHFTEVEQVRNLGHDAKVPPNLRSAFTDWQKFTQKDRDLRKAVAETQAAVERERRTMALSVGQVADLESLQGDVQTKKVEVDVTTTAGLAKPYVVTLRKYNVQREGGGRGTSRWTIQSVTPKA